MMKMIASSHTEFDNDGRPVFDDDAAEVDAVAYGFGGVVVFGSGDRRP